MPRIVRALDNAASMPSNAALRTWVSVEVSDRRITRMGFPSAQEVWAPEKISTSLSEVRPALASTPEQTVERGGLANGMTLGPAERSSLRHAITSGVVAYSICRTPAASSLSFSGRSLSPISKTPAITALMPPPLPRPVGIVTEISVWDIVNALASIRAVPRPALVPPIVREVAKLGVDKAWLLRTPITSSGLNRRGTQNRRRTSLNSSRDLTS